MESCTRKIILILSIALSSLCVRGVYASVSLTPDWEKIAGNKLPDIVFLDSGGKQIRLSDYKGKLLILHPMFTHCPSACSIVSRQISKAVSGLSDSQRENLRVVSFSFDPDETVQGLARFEKMLHNDPALWKVVRATPDQIRQLLTALDFKTLQIAQSNFEHANLIFIVSGSGQLLDYVFGSELTAERITQALQNSGKGRLASKSTILVLAVIGLLISTFVAVTMLTRSERRL